MTHNGAKFFDFAGFVFELACFEGSGPMWGGTRDTFVPLFGLRSFRSHFELALLFRFLELFRAEETFLSESHPE